MGKLKKETFSVPNILSYLRILLIPVFVTLYFKGEYICAAMIVALSGLTDLADGFIARRFNMITEWGKVLDPIADKLTQALLIVCLLSRYEKMWILVIIFFIKELTMGLAGLIMLCKRKRRLNGAMWFGKISTVVQFVAMTALFAFRLPEPWADAVISVCAAFMILAFVLYMRAYAHLAKHKINEPA